MPIISSNRNITLVAATNTLVVDKNPNRQYLLIQNHGAGSEVYLGVGQGAVSNRGIRLNVDGGAYEITKDNLFHGEIYAISAGAPTVSVIEW